jgi:hypothetical protein
MHLLSPQEPPQFPPPPEPLPFQWGIVIGLGCFVAALLLIAVARGWL